MNTSTKTSKEQELASRQYISIIRLFNHCDISTEKDFNLPRAKKQLQAEFSVAKDGFMEVDGYVYTRQDVFEELDHKDFPTRLQFHKQIWNTAPMLNLLEDNEVNFLTIRDAFRPFWNNCEFDRFFSPYFEAPFNYASRNLLGEKRLFQMGELLSFEDFLQADEREEAFRPLRIFFEENLRLLRNVNSDNYKMMRPRIAHWVDEDWHPLLNSLPDEFYDLKVDLTIYLINLGVAIQHSYKKDCRRMSDQLVLVEGLPDHIEERISANHTVYSRTGKGSVNFRSYFWIGWIVLILARVISAGGFEDRDTSPDYLQNTILNSSQVDSLLKAAKDSNKTLTIDSSLINHVSKNQLH